MREKKVTFGVPATVVFDMDMKRGPLPPGVQARSGRLDNATVVISCTEREARAMAAWLASQPEKSMDYEAVVKLINLTLVQGAAAAG